MNYFFLPIQKYPPLVKGSQSGSPCSKLSHSVATTLNVFSFSYLFLQNISLIRAIHNSKYTKLIHKYMDILLQNFAPQ